MGSHPACCRNPESCNLSYVEHLRGFSIGAEAMPTRAPNAIQQKIRTKRWERDMDAYRRLRKEGFHPPKIDGSRLRERQGENAYDINERPVKIDYTDPT